VHIPHETPSTAAPSEGRVGAAHRQTRRRERRSRFGDPEIDWQQHGLEPRWLGMETSDCAAAIDPSIFHSRGAAELDRFLTATNARGELALIVATIGDADDEFFRSQFGAADASVPLPGYAGSISGVRLPAGVRPTLAPNAKGADKDLGLRLLNRRDDAPWWSLSVSGMTLDSQFGPSEHREPTGRLEPILVDALGAPVVAVWVPDSGDQRWYAVPDGTDPNIILGWLSSQGLPEHVSGALRRVRAPHAVIPSLQTPAEESAREALAELEASFDQERQRLTDELREASALAEPIRHGLLYGTGGELVEAVATVLSAAGLTVIDVDELLGDTASADLLVSHGADRRLVEVKSASGNASERLIADLERHLQTWPQIRPEEPVAGGVLVVNHQHRRDPDERTAEIYTRTDFVSALTVPVVPPRQLFDWWRNADWSAIRAAVLSVPGQRGATSARAPAQDSPGTPPIEQDAAAPKRRWWRQQRQRRAD